MSFFSRKSSTIAAAFGLAAIMAAGCSQEQKIPGTAAEGEAYVRDLKNGVLKDLEACGFPIAITKNPPLTEAQLLEGYDFEQEARAEDNAMGIYTVDGKTRNACRYVPANQLPGILEQTISDDILTHRTDLLKIYNCKALRDPFFGGPDPVLEGVIEQIDNGGWRVAPGEYAANVKLVAGYCADLNEELQRVRYCGEDRFTSSLQPRRRWTGDFKQTNETPEAFENRSNKIRGTMLPASTPHECVITETGQWDDGQTYRASTYLPLLPGDAWPEDRYTAQHMIGTEGPERADMVVRFAVIPFLRDKRPEVLTCLEKSGSELFGPDFK